jgi:hypothetical protein
MSVVSIRNENRSDLIKRISGSPELETITSQEMIGCEFILSIRPDDTMQSRVLRCTSERYCIIKHVLSTN